MEFCSLDVITVKSGLADTGVDIGGDVLDPLNTGNGAVEPGALDTGNSSVDPSATLAGADFIDVGDAVDDGGTSVSPVKAGRPT